jgi:hypothetical protein
MPQEARISSRGRTSGARSPRAIHVSDTNSPHSHASSEVDVSAVQPKVAKAALGNFFESVFESASKKSSDEQSRGAYSTVSKMAASKKSHRSSEPRDKNIKVKEQLGSFFDDVKSKKEPEEDDDQSRGAYSTVSKMNKSSSRLRSKSRNGKDRLPSRKPSSPKELSTDKKAEGLGLGSFIHDQTPVDVEEDIEVQSAQVGGVSSRRSRSRSGRDRPRLSSRKKREAPQPVASGKKGSANREELLALFRTVSSPSDYIMTDEMRHEVGTAENWTSRIANEDKVLAYGKEKTRISRSSDEVYTNREHGSSKATLDTVDRSLATLIKGVRARSSLSTSTALPVPDERKTQTTRRTIHSSNRSPPRNRTRSKSRSRRSSNKDRSKSRSRMNIDESTSDAMKSPRPKSRSRINIDVSTSDVMKSPRPKSRSSKQSDESGSDAIKSPRKSGSRRNSVESDSDAIKSPRPKSESGTSSKDSGRRHKDHKDAPRQKSSRRLADDEGDSRPQRQKSSRRLVEESPRRQTATRRLAEEPSRRQSSSRRLVAKDSPKKSSRSAHEEPEGIPRRSKHSSSKRPSNENPSTHSSSRRLSNEERSNHSSSRRLSNEEPSSPTSSAKIQTHKHSSHQRQPQRLVVDAPIFEGEDEQPANYFEQDIFSLYTWSSARTDTQRIQKERKILKDSLRDSPLFRVFPQQCIL